MTWYLAQRLFDGQDFHQDVYFEAKDNRIVSFCSASVGLANGQIPSSYKRLKGTVVPGFVDTQVNGGGGVLFNQTPTYEALCTIASAHYQFGTRAMTPTLITDQYTVMQKAADAMAQAIANEHPNIVGIHFEGPHLSAPKRGIHPEQAIRKIDDAELALFTRKDLGRVVLTLAPENVPADIISDLVKQGVIVSLGHTNADYETAMRAMEAGATGATHLYNAMSGLSARAPGVIGASLDSDAITAGLIADLHHVSAANCRLAFRAKSASKIMLVTDAMAHVGTDLDKLPWADSTISRTGSKLTMPDGTLAGSCLDMLQAVQIAHQKMGIALDEVLTSATHTPAQFLNLPHLGSLKLGSIANFIELNDSLS
jgi:N-acetylglucosamine-6-phosphate deacetylase